jgi:papain like protease
MSSDLFDSEIVIDDESPSIIWETPDGMSTGYMAGARTTPYGRMATTTPFPSELIIPESEWQARIAEKEQRQNRISDLVLQAKLPSKNQQQTNYCWCNAPTGTVEMLRVIENEPMVSLSAASVGGPITGYKNVGGWGESALKYIVDNGIVPESLWPVNAINAKYHTPANVQAALDYRIVGWYELVPKNTDQMISCLLRNIPVAVGLNWWGHEVVFCDAVWLNGAIAIRFRNSWGNSYGSQGFSVLQGTKILADDAVCPLSTVAA